MQINTMPAHNLGYFNSLNEFKRHFSFNKDFTCESQLTNAELHIAGKTYQVQLHANDLAVAPKQNGYDSSWTKKLKDRLTDQSDTIEKTLCKKTRGHSPFLRKVMNGEQKYLKYYDVIIPHPDIHDTVESAKTALEVECDRQHKLIDKLNVQPKYEQLNSKGSIMIGSQKSRFRHDVNVWLALSKAAIEAKGAHIPTTYERAWCNMQCLELYREWSVRDQNSWQSTPDLPKFAAVEPKQGQGGVETQLCSLFCTGILHYDIFKPLCPDDAAWKFAAGGFNKKKRQEAWQQFHRDVVRNSDPSKRIKIPEPIRTTFHQQQGGQDWVDFTGVYCTNSANLFEGPILCHTKPLPTGSRHEQLATLRAQIKSDWQCCRLRADDPNRGEVFLNFVHQKNDNIYSMNHPIDCSGFIFRNRHEFYHLFADHQLFQQKTNDGFSSTKHHSKDESLGIINLSADELLFKKTSPLKPTDLLFIE